MNQTIETLAAEYAPYNTMQAFAEGVADYQSGKKLSERQGMDAQAYDRGAECAMRVARHNRRIAEQGGT